MSNDKPGLENLNAEDLKLVLGASSGASQAIANRQMEEVANSGGRDAIARAERMLPTPYATRANLERDADDRPPMAVSVYIRGQERLPVHTGSSARPERAGARGGDDSRTDDTTVIGKLERLIDMRLRSLITDDEFRAMKRRLAKQQ